MTNLPAKFTQQLERDIGDSIVELRPLSGGDFASAYKATLQRGNTVFIKTHNDPPAGFFSAEALGLSWLQESGTVPVPDVLAVNDEIPYLVLQWIETGPASSRRELNRNSTGEADFGRALSGLHRSEWNGFGRPDDHSTGSLALPNTPTQSWTEFYAQRRLMPLSRIAAEANALPGASIKKIERLALRLGEFVDSDLKPSLLHGDLWAGNRMVDVMGSSWLVDPAAHGGHREFDLAMMRLFGGFEDECFDAYHESWPLDAGWQQRVKLHQLAPLIVHAIKFGGSYGSAVSDVLSLYV